jgi:hypothetical protein
MGDFSMIAADSRNRRRGSELEVPVYPINLQFIPGFNIFGRSFENTTNNVLVGVFLGMAHNLDGVGAASRGLINTGYVRGVQASGVFNYAGNIVHGLQAAGVANYTGGDAGLLQAAGVANFAGGSVRGVQSAGIVNSAGGSVKGMQAAGIVNYAGSLHGLQAGLVNVNRGGMGVQIGLVNVSRSEDMVPIGLVNIIKNGMFHPAVYVDDMLFSNLSLKTGSKHFYGLLSAGTRPEALFDSSKDKYLITRAGFGFEYNISRFFVDVDVSSGNLIRLKKEDAVYSTNLNQLRLSAGYKILPHLSIFGGVSYDYFFLYKDNSPDPRDFGRPILAGTLPGTSTASNRHIHKLGFFGGIQF